MKKFSLLLIFSALILVAFSCKKDKSESNTDKLTGKYWIATAITIDPAINLGGTQISDWYAQMDACEKDNLQKFDKNGIYTFDEGASKCDVADPQTTTGTWAFNTDETVISVTDVDGTYSYTIIDLSSSTCKFKYSEVFNSITYTFTVTMIEKK
jgi:hypothetical protein